MTHRSIAIAFVGIMLSFTYVPSVSAEATDGLKVQPAVVEDKANPGQAYQFTVTVTNIASVERSYTVSTKDINGLDDSGRPIFAPKDQETAYSLSSWIQVPTAPIVLKAGESRAVSLTALVPSNASPGAHFGGIFFNYLSDPQTNTGSAVNFEVGDVISLQIAGTVLEDARLREFSTNKILYGSPDVTFTTKLENLGNILERPQGVIQITDMFGKQVASLSVNDALAPVFPGSTRPYVVNWKDDGFAIGRYQAIVSFSYGSDGKRTISATTSFWIIPLKLVATVMGALLIVILAVYFWVRMYVRQKLSGVRSAAGTADTDLSYYGRKHNRTGSRLTIILVVALLASAILLAVLFIMFA
ncbi:MAG: hypothetical protein RLZZ26_361 [Candidatus Parcubacteria bacterium]|jgi:hypothetical protein